MRFSAFPGNPIKPRHERYRRYRDIAGSDGSEVSGGSRASGGLGSRAGSGGFGGFVSGRRSRGFEGLGSREEGKFRGYMPYKRYRRCWRYRLSILPATHNETAVSEFCKNRTLEELTELHFPTEDTIY
jgi:hypothetical protein